jgi:hypothetical protein
MSGSISSTACMPSQRRQWSSLPTVPFLANPYTELHRRLLAAHQLTNIQRVKQLFTPYTYKISGLERSPLKRSRDDRSGMERSGNKRSGVVKVQLQKVLKKRSRFLFCQIQQNNIFIFIRLFCIKRFINYKRPWR